MIGAEDQVTASMASNERHGPDPETSDIVGEGASSANAAGPTSTEHTIWVASHKTDVYGRPNDALELSLSSPGQIMSWDRS